MRGAHGAGGRFAHQDLEEHRQANLEEESVAKNGVWADLEDEQLEEETVYDDLTGKVQKYKNVLEARMNEVEALIKMGVWRQVPIATCLSRTGK